MLHIPLPETIFSFAQIIGNANAFVAMFMIGVGFKMAGDLKQAGTIIKILVTRYSVAVVIALCCYFLLPLPLEMRQALVILAFSPVATAAPAYTAELGGDSGLASAVNSMTILCSIVFIVIILILLL